MKKRFSVILVTVLCMALQSMAQMTLKVPQWEKFVKVNKEGINLRKAPNINSPKLMSYGEDWYQEFSWTPQKDFTAFHPEVGEVFPVLKENSEWYCLYFDDHCYASLNGTYEVYVMKKYCTMVRPIALTYEDYKYSECGTIAGGKGYYLGVYYLGSPSRAPWWRVGQQVGNYLVMADYDGSNMDFIRKFCTGETSMDMEFDITEVTESDVDKYIQGQKEPSVFDIWIKFPGERPIKKFVVDASTYNYKMETKTFEPLHIRKFVVSANGEELQMREKPYATSKPLIFLEDEDAGMYIVGALKWDNGRFDKERSEPAKSKLFCVIGEEGDWYKVYATYHYFVSYGQIGYIPKKDCKDAVLLPITTEAFANDTGIEDYIINMYYKDKILIESGFPRLHFGSINDWFRIGSIEGNVVKLNYNFTGLSSEVSENKVSIGSTTFYGKKLVKRNSDNELAINLSKFSWGDINKLKRENDFGPVVGYYLNIEGIGIQAIYSHYEGHELIIDNMNP